MLIYVVTLTSNKFVWSEQICWSGMVKKLSKLQMKITMFLCFMLYALSRLGSFVLGVMIH